MISKLFDKDKYISRLEQIVLALDIQHLTTIDCLINYDLLLNALVRDYFAELSRDQMEGHLIAMARKLNKSNIIASIKAQRKL